MAAATGRALASFCISTALSNPALHLPGLQGVREQVWRKGPHAAPLPRTTNVTMYRLRFFNDAQARAKKAQPARSTMSVANRSCNQFDVCWPIKSVLVNAVASRPWRQHRHRQGRPMASRVMLAMFLHLLRRHGKTPCGAVFFKRPGAVADQSCCAVRPQAC